MNYSQIANAVYVILIAIAFFMEISHKVDTDHWAKKIGLGLIVIGALLHISDKANNFIPIGISFYFGVILLRAFLNKYGRRTSDRRELGKR